MARDGDPLEKYCRGPGIQNYSFTMEVAEEILRRSGREWCSDLKIPSEEEYIDYNGDEDCSNSANAHVSDWVKRFYIWNGTGAWY